MKIKNNTVLITGGGSGIGLALALKLSQTGNTVIICGRNEDRLKKAIKDNPLLHYMACDIIKDADRNRLLKQMEERFPALNILVNNAAVQIYMDLADVESNLADVDIQIETNFTAPIKLIGMMMPLLLTKENAAIINISSDLAYVPMALAPVYCVTKAAMHSYTRSLRYQLRDRFIKVFEIFPSITKTELDKLDRKKADPVHVARKIVSGVSKDRLEMRIGQAKIVYLMSRLCPKFAHSILNKIVSTSEKKDASR